MRGKKKRGWKRVWWELRYRMAYWSLRSLFLFTYFFPLRWAFFLLQGIGGKIGWYLTGEYKKKMLDNLSLSFKDSLTLEEKRQISHESFLNMVRGFVELLYFVHFYKDKFDPAITMEGRENLEKVFALGKGVIAVSAHLGNFILLCAKLSLSGFPFSVIIKEPNHPAMAKIFRWARKEVGVKAIYLAPPLKCQREILRSLRKGEIVCFISDQNQKKGGVLMEFLGRIMAMPVGPAIYHLKTRAPILPLFILRNENRTHKVIINEPLKVDLSGDEERDIFSITAQVTQVIESYIKRYPEQWPWISKRRIRTKTSRKTFLEQGLN
jgi:KDO2-lipid IV(A) lauroyltransferase